MPVTNQFNIQFMSTQTTILCIVLAITGLLHSFNIVIAQTTMGKHTVSGTVADSATQKPMAKVSLQIRTGLLRPVQLSISKADGSFTFSGLEAGTYSIELVAAGYYEELLTVDLTGNASKNKDLGIVYLPVVTGNLQGVVVNARKSIIKQEIDRIVYDLQADPDSKGNSVLEMMRKVPYLSLDADDNILLKGNNSYKILINGRPSGMMEKNPRDVLRSMPASSIQRIEVITNPPSKYDGEGLAGIINIITNKKIAEGYNGTLNLNGKLPVGGPGMGGSITVKEGKLGLSAFGGASGSHSPLVNNSINRQISGANSSSLMQQSVRGSDGRSGYFGSEVSLEIDSLQLLSAQLNGNGSYSEGTSDLYSLLGSHSSTQQQYRLANRNKGNGNGFDASLNYQLGSKKDKNRLITFSYRYSNYGNQANSNLQVSDTVNYEQPDYRQENEEDAAEHTFQVDYVRPLKKVNMEAGVKGILRKNKSNFGYLAYDDVSGKFEPDENRSNRFTNRQEIFGAYNTWQFSLHNWSFKAGARIEQTLVTADFISAASQVKQNYLNVIPTALVSRKWNNSNTVTIGWMQRIKRPNIYKLNPFVDRSNPSVESSGNPALLPTTINELQLGYSSTKKLSVTLGVAYGFAKGLDMRVASFDPVKNITRVTFENIGKATRTGCDFSLSYPISKRWNASVNGNAAYFKAEGIADGVWLKNDWMMYSYTVSSGYRFTKGWRASANLSVNSRNTNSLQSSSNGLARTSFSVNKELVKDKLSFSAGVNNPFSQYRNNISETVGNDFTEINTTAEYFRSFSLSVNYSFGKLKEAIRKNKRGIKNDDGGGGN
jgi:hypothetical protein